MEYKTAKHDEYLYVVHAAPKHYLTPRASAEDANPVNYDIWCQTDELKLDYYGAKIYTDRKGRPRPSQFPVYVVKRELALSSEDRGLDMPELISLIHAGDLSVTVTWELALFDTAADNADKYIDALLDVNGLYDGVSRSVHMEQSSSTPVLVGLDMRFHTGTMGRAAACSRGAICLP